jgi:D-3-phosphoglycerate dehydrogenase
VASALVKFINTGSTLGAVNFPEVDIRYSHGKNCF